MILDVVYYYKYNVKYVSKGLGYNIMYVCNFKSNKNTWYYCIHIQIHFYAL